MIVSNVGLFGKESRSILVNYPKFVFKKKSFLLLGLEEYERHFPYMHDFRYILLTALLHPCPKRCVTASYGRMRHGE